MVPTASAVRATSQPGISLSADSGSAGTSLTITAQGFPPGAIVALYIDQPGPYLYLQGVAPPGPKADANGGFSEVTKWPDNHYDTSGKVKPGSGGVHQLCGDTGYPGNTNAVTVKACAPFTVLAVTSPTPSSKPKPQPSGLPLPLVGLAIGVVLVLGVAGWWFTRGPD